MKSRILMFFTIVFLGIAGCSDPCKDAGCANGATCDDGDCICTQGYMGPTCEQEISPSSMRITKIVVTSFTNSGWDTFPSSSPDIFVTVGSGTSCSGSLYSSEYYYTNAYPGPSYDFIPSSPIVISNPTTPVSICLYDYDGISLNDLMDGFYFNPYISGEGFPSVKTKSNGILTFNVHYMYYW